ncbi:unnamed protein product [Parnassius apollo]|uniref:(apollo) hypothetical protein n=1 Tax=Parnassius apollo TaxID=110799 RepID=A0A8S3WB45_PARAO|nr:unnamed protein product [Parnassius apollo]
MEELKQKIVALEEELSKTHEEYITRISRLEEEVLTLRQTGGLERFTLQQSELQTEQLLQRLRAAEARCDDINLQLSIEKGKVFELETRLRAADISTQIAKTIEQHLKNTNSERHISTNLVEQEDTKISQKRPKSCDDSGYVDAIMPDDRKSPDKDTNNELREKILDLQSQINAIKLQAATEKDAEKKIPNFERYDLVIDEDEVSLLKSVNDSSNMMKDFPLARIDNLNAENIEIKNSGVNIQQDRGQDSFNNRVPTSDTLQKPSESLPASGKGISETSEQYTAITHKNNEKIENSVSYEKFIPDKMKEGNVETDEQQNTLHTMTGYSAANFVDVESAPNDNLSFKKSNKNDETKQSDQITKDVTTENLNYKPESPEIAEKKTGNVKDLHSDTKDNRDKEKSKQKFKRESDVLNRKKFGLDIPKSGFNVYSKEANSAMKDIPNKNTNFDYIEPKFRKERTLRNSKLQKSSSALELTDNVQHKNNVQVPKGDRIGTEKNLKNGKGRVTRKKEPVRNVKKQNHSKKKTDLNTRQSVKAKAHEIEQLGVDKQADECSCSSARTYTVRQGADDTDGEISGFTDLPDETDESPRVVLSPGEQVASVYTCTDCTETCTSAADCLTLSEGELPFAAEGRVLSPGERKWKSSSGEVSAEVTSPQKMQQTLQSIGAEVQRCSRLLQHVQKSTSATTASPAGTEPHLPG